MDITLRDDFLRLWARYFDGAELPLALYYTEGPVEGLLEPAKGQVCVVGQLARARRGERLAFDAAAVGCAGGKRFLGFETEMRPGFEHFLSTGIPGKMEGERYKKTPEIVREAFGRVKAFEAPARYIVFKRWDLLAEADEPAVVVFFAPPDVLSGLFTLSGFDESDVNAVIAPFSAGCGTIVQYPMLEQESDHPRAVLGNFDVSSRPCLAPNELTFAVPMRKFERMVPNMDESFLITDAWAKVLRRIKSAEVEGFRSA